VGALAYLGAPSLMRDTVDFSAVRVMGRPVADAAEARKVAEEEGQKALARRVLLRLPSAAGLPASPGASASQPAGEVSLADLGVTVDVDEVAAQATRAATSRGLFGGVAASLSHRLSPPSPTDLPLRFRLDDATFARYLATVKESADYPPQSARLDLDQHQVVPEKKGRYLDLFAAGAAVLRAAASDETTVLLPAQFFEPRVSSAFVKSLDITTVLAEYETHFSRAGDQARRGSNIDVAASKLDGVIISPGELISFNNIVGERSEANGFKKSWEIFKGEMVEGVGGGTCQVASTFHAASFFSGLDVLERLPHSRPSAYIPMGLDSTVVYPAVDLKMRNPHPFPVVIHAKTSGNTLKVEVLGKERPVTVHFARDVVGTIPFSRKVVEDPALSGKRVVHKQHGIRGYRVRRTRELRYQDGTSRVETTTDFYPPTADIFHVPVGFDANLLPALPEDPDGVSKGGRDGRDASSAGAQTNASTQAGGAGTQPGGAGAAGSASGSASDGELEIVDGRGAHAPSSQQAAPSRSMRITR
jgi:vancomycin resistance protein YoaR